MAPDEDPDVAELRRYNHAACEHPPDRVTWTYAAIGGREGVYGGWTQVPVAVCTACGQYVPAAVETLALEALRGRT